MDNIKIIKLSTSEEIICKLIEVGENVVKVTCPMGIAPSPTGEGLAIFPWSVSGLRGNDNEIFEINKVSVVMMHDAPSEIASSYYTHTSKIYTPTVQEKSLILG